MHTKLHAYAIACTHSHTRSFIHSLVHAHTTATWMGRSWYLKTWWSSSCRRRIIYMSLSPPRPRLVFLALALTPSWFLLSRSVPPATLRWYILCLYVVACTCVCLFLWACRLSRQTIHNLYMKMQTTSLLQATGFANGMRLIKIV